MAALSVLDGLPLFWPAMILALALAALAAVPVARLLQAPVWVALLLLGSLGVIVAITLTPATPAYFDAGTPIGCLHDGFVPPALDDLLQLNQTSLNVFLFVPLGLACALLPRWWQVTLGWLFAVALPFVIEMAQYEVPRLGRVCSTADMAANLTGLFAGVIGGLLLARPLLSSARVAQGYGERVR